MNYEIVCILSPKIIEKELKKHTQKIIKLLEDNKASDVQDNLWGKKPLAFKIKGFSDGYYVQYNFDIEPENIKELDNRLKLIDEVIRFLITKQEDNGEVKVLQNGEKEEVKEDKKVEKEEKLEDLPEPEIEEPVTVEKKAKEKPEVKEKAEEKTKEKEKKSPKSVMGEDDLDKKIDEVLSKDIVD